MPEKHPYRGKGCSNDPVRPPARPPGPPTCVRKGKKCESFVFFFKSSKLLSNTTFLGVLSFQYRKLPTCYTTESRFFTIHVCTPPAVGMKLFSVFSSQNAPERLPETFWVHTGLSIGAPYAPFFNCHVWVDFLGF
jgi:hypothetical protein